METHLAISFAWNVLSKLFIKCCVMHTLFPFLHVYVYVCTYITYMYRCCQNQRSNGASCTYPLSQNSFSGTFCPVQPRVSLLDASQGVAGRLDSDNTYVDEYLLRFSEKTEQYHSTLMGGFTIGQQEPIFSACGCGDVNTFVEEYVAPLQQCEERNNTSIYSIPNAFEWYTSTNCSSLITDSNGSGSSANNGEVISGLFTLLPLNSTLTVDGSSTGTLQDLSCSTNSECQNGRPISKFYPEQTSRTSVTVWYSGKVSISTLCLCIKY